MLQRDQRGDDDGRAVGEHRGELVLSPSGDWENHEEEWEELSPALEDTQDPNVDERFADDEDEDELDR